MKEIDFGTLTAEEREVFDNRQVVDSMWLGEQEDEEEDDIT